MAFQSIIMYKKEVTSTIHKAPFPVAYISTFTHLLLPVLNFYFILYSWKLIIEKHIPDLLNLM